MSLHTICNRTGAFGLAALWPMHCLAGYQGAELVHILRLFSSGVGVFIRFSFPRAEVTEDRSPWGLSPDNPAQAVCLTNGTPEMLCLPAGNILQVSAAILETVRQHKPGVHQLLVLSNPVHISFLTGVEVPDLTGSCARSGNLSINLRTNCPENQRIPNISGGRTTPPSSLNTPGDVTERGIGLPVENL